MKISIITLFPEMIRSFLAESIIKRAQEKGAVTIEMINLRDFALDSYGTVDDRPYGGGAGMVLRADVIAKAVMSHQSKDQSQKSRVILTSAKGKPFHQKKAQELSKLDHLIIIAGHYEGVDDRVMKQIDEEVSLGDFVLTGGEIPAAAIVDAVVRLLPGVLKKEEATQEESFFDVALHELIAVVGKTELLDALERQKVTTVQLIEYPQYTRPEEFEGQKVPEILLSGNHEEIRKWRLHQAYMQTVEKRPDLLDKKRE